MRHLKASRQAGSKVWCVLQYQLAAFYRGRQGRHHQRAAASAISEARRAYKEQADRRGIEWLESRIAYEDAYLEFLHGDNHELALGLFSESELSARRRGDAVGAAASRAASLAIRHRRGEDVAGELLTIQDSLATAAGDVARLWRDENTVVHLAGGAIIARRFHEAYDLLSPLESSLAVGARARYAQGIAATLTGALDPDLARREA